MRSASVDNPEETKSRPVQFTIARQLKNVPIPFGFVDMVKKQGSRVEVVSNERALLNFLIGIACFCIHAFFKGSLLF